MAPLPTQPIRDEHAELVPHIERLRALGDAALAGADDVLTRLQESVEFLHHHLLVHAGAEERVLYPAVSGLLGSTRATATMSRDHVEVERLAKELAAVSPTDRVSIARLAYGLYALVSVHFAKEEEVYLPVLDAAMSAEEVGTLYAEMEQAAAGIRHGA